MGRTALGSTISGVIGDFSSPAGIECRSSFYRAGDAEPFVFKCNPLWDDMMIAVVIDVGGTKIEAQTFDALWQCVDKLRFETRKTYEELVDVIFQAV